MELTANLRFKQSPLLKPVLYCVVKLMIYGLIKPKTASRWATRAADRAFKYRVNKGPWQRMDVDFEIDVTVDEESE